MLHRAEFNMSENDCSFCPCFSREGNDFATCRLADVRHEPQFMSGILVPGKHGDTMAFPIPLDCPLDATRVVKLSCAGRVKSPCMPLYVVVDVGCIECGEPSGVIGVFDDEHVAEMVASDCDDLQRQRWVGEHHYVVQRVDGINEASYVPYYVARFSSPRCSPRCLHEWDDE